MALETYSEQSGTAPRGVCCRGRLTSCDHRWRHHRPDNHRYRLDRRRFRLWIEVADRHEIVRFGIISRYRPPWDVVSVHFEPRQDPARRRVRPGFQFDKGVLFDLPFNHIGCIDEHHHPAADHAAIAVIKAVDRRVVLIMASYRRQQQDVGIRGRWILRDAVMTRKLARPVGVSRLARAVRLQVKATRLMDLAIEFAEQVQDGRPRSCHGSARSLLPSRPSRCRCPAA